MCRTYASSKLMYLFKVFDVIHNCHYAVYNYSKMIMRFAFTKDLVFFVHFLFVCFLFLLFFWGDKTCGLLYLYVFCSEYICINLLLSAFTGLCDIHQLWDSDYGAVHSTGDLCSSDDVWRDSS